ncbi:MAG: hypothetical protein IT317_12795 [Anaerolineales bacterium]|nr:hypothetical protein [Anaerolineales bacterium]
MSRGSRGPKLIRFRRHWPGLVYGLLLALAAGLRLGGLTQLPHTLWVDEAWFSLQGRVVLSGANLLPLQPPGLGIGDSAFQIYAAALAQALGAPAAYASRTASAVTGLLVVVAAYPVLLALMRTLWDERPAQLAALTATALLATNFTALLHSRGGLQMSGAALATVLIAGGLWFTFQRGSWRWALATGVVVGLGQTTYEAALGLPVLVVLYTAIRWAWPSGPSRWQAPALGGLVLGAALAAFSPLLVFYYFHPGIYLAHVGQAQTVTGAVGPLATLGQALSGLERVIGGLALAGDRLPGRNVIGRPLFDWAAALLLLVGVIWGAGCGRRRPAVQLLFAWLTAMALPSALSDEAPAFSRMLPLVPALAAVAGIGAAAAWQWARPKLRPGVTALVAAGVIVSAGLSIQAYFVKWPAQPGVFDALHFGARLTAEAALAQTPAATVFVLPGYAPFVAGPFELLLDPTPVQRLDAGACLPYADSAARDTVYGVIQVMDAETLPRLQSAYPTGAVVATVPHPAGYAYALFFRVPAGTAAPAPEYAVSVTFANGLQLTGYSAPASVGPGATIDVQLFWRAEAPVAGDWNAFLHLGRGRNSNPMLGQADAPLCPNFPPARWTPGYVYVETRAVTLTADAPLGGYDLRVGLYPPRVLERVPIIAANVAVEDDRAVLGAFQVR